MKKNWQWIVVVKFGYGKNIAVRVIRTDVGHGENAIVQGMARNSGPGYNWDDAEIRKVKR